MIFYDAHVHYLWEGSLEKSYRGWEGLRARGLRGMAVIIMGHHLAHPKRCLDLVPTSYHHRIDAGVFERRPEPDACVPGPMDGIPLFPYLDSRFIEEEQSDLTPFQEGGFRGLKILYIPEEDRENGMIGWKRLFGRSMAASEDLTARLVDQASGFGWPVILHADLRRYGPFVEELVKAHPHTPFVVPHFGFSRKAMAGLIDRTAHVHTDFSSLLPFMRRDPEAYETFICTYPDRVLFGTDTLVGWPALTEEYVDFVKSILRDEEVRGKVFEENYLRIHGPSDA